MASMVGDKGYVGICVLKSLNSTDISTSPRHYVLQAHLNS